MKRRHFLLSSLLPLASLGLRTSQSQLILDEANLDVIAKPDLLTLLNNEQEILSIGRIYRQRNQRENDVNFLQRKIEQSVQESSFINRQSLQQAISTEFEKGRTLQINGWILSITESRQCALFSLLYA